MKATAPEDKVPLKEKLAYGAGGMNDSLMGNAFHNIANPILNMTLGVSTSVIGVAMFIPNLWNAFSDPIIGHASDQTKSRFGRRKPFLLIGAIIASLALIGLWGFLPTEASENTYFWMLLIGAIVFFTGTTLFLVPWNALGFEMTADYNERTRLMSVRSLMAVSAGFTLPWIAAILFWDGFRSPLSAVLWLSIGLSVIFIICALIPSLFCKERLKETADKQKTVSLVKGVGQTIGNRPFLLVTATVLVLITSFFMVDILGQYLIFYYMYNGNLETGAVLHGINGTANSIIALGAIPIATWLATRFGKRRIIMIFMVMASVGALLRWFFYVPGQSYVILVSTFLIAPGFSALWLLVPSLLADVCDFEELRTGRRAEATIGAVYGWVTKLGFSVAFFIGNVSLDLIGFNVDLSGEQSEQTFFLMRALFVAIPTIGFALGGFLMYKYELSPRRMEEIKTELEARRSKA